ncbi:MAG: YciI family protein [Minicystis sp.]
MQPTHFVYLIYPPRPTFLQDATPDEKEIMGRHFAYLKELSERGKLLLAGPTLDGAFGIGIFKTSDAAEAQRFADGDPAVVSGLVKPVLHPARLSFLPE